MSESVRHALPARRWPRVARSHKIVQNTTITKQKNKLQTPLRTQLPLHSAPTTFHLQRVGDPKEPVERRKEREESKNKEIKSTKREKR